MKYLFLLCCLSFSSLTFAFSKAQIDQTLQQMESSGMFSKEQVSAARQRLSGMSANELTALEKNARASANDPKVRAKAQELIQRKPSSF